MIHELKVWTEYFDLILSGKKKFELRKNDRDFKTGDILFLRDYDPIKGLYTGRCTNKYITYVLNDALNFGLIDGYVILSLS